MEVVTNALGTKVSTENGVFHCGFGPAILFQDGEELWYVTGIGLSRSEIIRAKMILSGELWVKIPKYINHPTLKYFCQYVLSKGPI